MDLPDEIWTEVFVQLGPDEIGSWKLTCRKFRRIARRMINFGRFLRNAFQNATDLLECCRTVYSINHHYQGTEKKSGLRGIRRADIPLSKDVQLLLFLKKRGFDFLEPAIPVAFEEVLKIWGAFLVFEPIDETVKPDSSVVLSYEEQIAWQIPLTVARKRSFHPEVVKTLIRKYRELNNLYDRVCRQPEQSRKKEDLDRLYSYLNKNVQVHKRKRDGWEGNVQLGTHGDSIDLGYCLCWEVHNTLKELFPFLDRDKMALVFAWDQKKVVPFNYRFWGREEYVLRYWPTLKSQICSWDRSRMTTTIREWLHDRNPIAYRL
jgi:hypothetical protein